jgi:hypothetical protein
MIAYYAHHHGSGHSHQAVAIAAHLTRPVIGLSSRPAPRGWAGPWVQLPNDVGDVNPITDDVTAGGVLHWAPRRHDGLLNRMRLISDALARYRVRLLVADVSVEVSLLARLHGVPVVVMAQPGDRTDPPHRAAYDLAERVLAPWPARTPSGWPRTWRQKTDHVGAFCRFDGLRPHHHSPGRQVMVLWGTGGLDVCPAQIQEAAAATPEWAWDVVGPPVPGVGGPPNLRWRGWLDDVWSALSIADVVVTHAGQNAVAEVAAARRPAVIVPQDRPHGEQRATGDMLVRCGIEAVELAWPRSQQWPLLLEQASLRGGGAWGHWSFGDGAERAAAILNQIAAGTR